MSAASGSKEDFLNNFHPSLKFTWAISDDKLPFLDLYLTPSPNRLITTFYYKETDSHSYLNYSSSHPVGCNNSIPYSQFLRLRRICSEEEDFTTRSEEMTSFFIRLRIFPIFYFNRRDTNLHWHQEYLFYIGRVDLTAYQIS